MCLMSAVGCFEGGVFMAGGGGPGDAVLVNAVIGAGRLGDFVDKAILEGREALALGGCFAGGV